MISFDKRSIFVISVFVVVVSSAVEVVFPDHGSAPIYSLIGVTGEMVSVMLLNLEQFVTKISSISVSLS